MNLEPLVSVIVVSYNTKDMTVECLRSVFRETVTTSFEVIVLDNASHDGSADAIREELGDRVQLVASDVNMGFAAGNNFVAQRARGKFLLLLNPDTVVLDRAIDRVMAFALENPSFEIWGGRTLFGDRRLNPTSCWSKQTVWSLFCQATGLSSAFRKSNLLNPEGMGGWDRSGVRNVDIVTGCFLLIRLEFWNQLGGFRERFFMYGEEADLCLRAKAMGARPATTSNATIIHYGGASQKVRADKLVRLLKAKSDLIRLHFPRYQRPLGFALLILWPFTRWMMHAALATISSKRIEARDTWREVVLRTKEWMAAPREKIPNS